LLFGIVVVKEEEGSRRRCPPIREVEEVLSGIKPEDEIDLPPEIDSMTPLLLPLVELGISKEFERLPCELQDPKVFVVVVIAAFLHCNNAS